jgi:phenylacetate-CoA ligase
MAPSVAVLLSQFASTHINQVLQPAEESGGECDPNAARARVLDLYALATAVVPAYKDFVSTGGAVQQDDQELSLDAVPFTTKRNYYHRYPLAERCQRGSLAAAHFLHSSSGSSGKPTYWCRNAFDELAVCARFEQVFRDNFHAQERTTLAVSGGCLWAQRGDRQWA